MKGDHRGKEKDGLGKEKKKRRKDSRDRREERGREEGIRVGKEGN